MVALGRFDVVAGGVDADGGRFHGRLCVVSAKQRAHSARSRDQRRLDYVPLTCTDSCTASREPRLAEPEGDGGGLVV